MCRSQFATSLLWTSLADRFSVRFVLFISLLGTAILTAAFGFCTTLKSAIIVRLCHGGFAGSIGVARGTISLVSDSTNESRAWAIASFAWGVGGVLGALIGGMLESPAVNYPGTALGSIRLLRTYPYALPCAIAAAIVLTGAVLALGLASDGGPRGKGIALTEANMSASAELGRSRSMSGTHTPDMMASGVSLPASQKPSPDYLSAPGFNRAISADSSPGRNSVSHPQAEASATRFTGRLQSISAMVSAARRGSVAATLYGYAPPQDMPEVEQSEPNFAQRLLMGARSFFYSDSFEPTDYFLLSANELAAPSLANLWLQSAIAADNDSPFIDDGLDEEAIVSDEEEDTTQLTPSRVRRSSGVSRGSRISRLRPQSPGPSPSAISSSRRGSRRGSVYRDTQAIRDGIQSGALPAIFQNTGLQDPPAMLVDLPAGLPASQHTAAAISDPFVDVAPLVTIEEDAPLTTSDLKVPEVKAPSPLSLLPWQLIAQFGLVAFHTTCHDQLFYTYVVSSYSSGGLGFSPADFSLLVASMLFAQIFYQFWLYPTVGPPRGGFSHLSMLRIGSLLYIPSYITVTLYRSLILFPSTGSTSRVTALLGIST